MPRVTIILLKHANGDAVLAFEADQAAVGSPAIVDKLLIETNFDFDGDGVPDAHTESLIIAGDPIRIDSDFLDSGGMAAGQYKLKQAAAELLLQAEWSFEDPDSCFYFGYRFDYAAGAVATLELHLPIVGVQVDAPFLVLCGQGKVQVATGPVFAAATMAFCVQIDKLPILGSPDVPLLVIHPPDVLPWPKLRIP